MSDDERRDPSAVTAQPALTRSTGRRWLIWGAALGIVVVVVLGFLVPVEPTTAIIGLVLVIAIYLAMVVVRLAVRPRRARLLTLASLLGGMAVVSVISILMVGVVSSGQV
nr:hypothetical protein [Microbacterium bovistercoris]